MCAPLLPDGNVEIKRLFRVNFEIPWLLRILATIGHKLYGWECVNLLHKPKCFLTSSNPFLGISELDTVGEPS